MLDDVDNSPLTKEEIREIRAFTKFLKDTRKRRHGFKKWELTILGGFGGYKSRAVTPKPRNKKSHVATNRAKNEIRRRR